MLSSEFNDISIIPNPGDKDTKLYTSFERIRARLPSLEGQAGKTLKVSADEEGCEWVTGSPGGTVSFADITGNPTDNPALSTELEKKVSKIPGTTDFSIAVDTTTGQLYFEV